MKFTQYYKLREAEENALSNLSGGPDNLDVGLDADAGADANDDPNSAESLISSLRQIMDIAKNALVSQGEDVENDDVEGDLEDDAADAMPSPEGDAEPLASPSADSASSLFGIQREL